MVDLSRAEDELLNMTSPVPFNVIGFEKAPKLSNCLRFGDPERVPPTIDVLSDSMTVGIIR